jgi:hypothetical protein
MRRAILSIRNKRVKVHQAMGTSFLSSEATPTSSSAIHQRYEASIFELRKQPPQKIRTIVDELEKLTPTKSKKHGKNSELNLALKQLVTEKAQSSATKKGSKSAEWIRSLIVNNITSQVIVFFKIRLNL